MGILSIIVSKSFEAAMLIAILIIVIEVFIAFSLVLAIEWLREYLRRK